MSVESSLTSVDERGVSEPPCGRPGAAPSAVPPQRYRASDHIRKTPENSVQARLRTRPKERKRPARRACRALVAERMTVVLSTCDQLCRLLRKP